MRIRARLSRFLGRVRGWVCRLVDFNRANERMIFIVGIILATIVLVSVVNHWPGFAIFLRWLSATIIGIGGSVAATLWQTRRWRAHGPRHRNQYLIASPDAEMPDDGWRCDECHMIIQASWPLDVLTTMIMLISLSWCISGAIVAWWSVAGTCLVICLLSFNLRRLNRQVLARRNRAGAIWRRGQTIFVFLICLLIAGLLVSIY